MAGVFTPKMCRVPGCGKKALHEITVRHGGYIYWKAVCKEHKDEFTHRDK